jgi:hypothetical protein
LLEVLGFVVRNARAFKRERQPVVVRVGGAPQLHLEQGHLRASVTIAHACCIPHSHTSLLKLAIKLACASRLTTALLVMLRARFAYLSVFSVSSKLMSAGLMQAIMRVPGVGMKCHEPNYGLV